MSKSRWNTYSGKPKSEGYIFIDNSSEGFILFKF